MDKKLVLERAKLAADYMIENQFTNRSDANHGRFRGAYEQSVGKISYTNSWQTGACCMGLLAMFKRTGDKKYLKAALRAGDYLKSLQNLDSRNMRYYGMIRESTPQTVEFCPRDAVTGCWAFIWLFRETQDQEYLDRAVIFAEWHMKYAMYNGWPTYTLFVNHAHRDFLARGCFQSGVGLFYYDLFNVTDDCRYIEKGLKPIADIYQRDFLTEDGSIIPERDVFTNKISERALKENDDNIHFYNDDFGCPMLLKAAEIFGERSYFDSAKRFAHWLAAHQQPDGMFRTKVKDVSSAVPMALMYYHEIGEKEQDKILLEARDKTLQKLLDMQLQDTDDRALYGAFEGFPDENHKADCRRSTNMRTTMYSLISLLKTEGKIRNFWLGGNLNDAFMDPLDYLKVMPWDESED